jgi:HAD superfamily hydrolase (TIGR01509 family)
MNEIKNKIKAIIFDMDGTIIDTEKAWRNVTLDVLQKNGFVTLTLEQEEFLGTLSGMGLVNAVIALKKHFNLQQSVEEIAAHKLELANFHLSSNVEFITGFEQFHKRLQDHAIPTSIATNASPENLKHLVKSMNFEKFFGKNIYCIADVQNRAKPDPAVFLHAAKQLGVEPSECIVFEDSLYGFQAAKAAGMKCIAIKNNLNKHLLDQVHDAIDSYHEAEKALKQI